MQWFRFYSGALDDPKVQRLPGDLFKVWVNLLCLANESDERGILPDRDDIAFRLRLDDQQAAEALRGLIRAGLLDEDEDGRLHIHGWERRQKKSDDVTARVHKHRGKGNDDETLPKRFSNALEKNRVEERESRPEKTPPIPPAEQRRPPADPAPPIGGERVRAVPKPTTLNSKQSDRFSRWYGGYPNRQHRPEAERAWRKLDPDDALTATLIADTAARQQGRKWSEGFIELPATYLNKRVWEDVIEQPRPQPLAVNGSPIAANSRFARNLRALQEADWPEHEQRTV